jgi:hypothetical protein
MPGQNPGDFGRLGRHKTQAIKPVALEKPAHGTVAQPAAAIEYEKQPLAEVFPFAHIYRDEATMLSDSIGAGGFNTSCKHRLLY